MKRLFKDILLLLLIVIAFGVYGHFSQMKFTVTLEDITAVKLALALASIIACIIVIRLFFLPYYIARDRKHRNTIPILLTNIFFGWSLVGWFIALIWANTCNVEPQIEKNQQETFATPLESKGYADKWNRAA